MRNMTSALCGEATTFNGHVYDNGSTFVPHNPSAPVHAHSLPVEQRFGDGIRFFFIPRHSKSIQWSKILPALTTKSHSSAYLPSHDLWLEGTALHSNPMSSSFFALSADNGTASLPAVATRRRCRLCVLTEDEQSKTKRGIDCQRRSRPQHLVALGWPDSPQYPNCGSSSYRFGTLQHGTGSEKMPAIESIIRHRRLTCNGHASVGSFKTRDKKVELRTMY